MPRQRRDDAKRAVRTKIAVARTKLDAEIEVLNMLMALPKDVAASIAAVITLSAAPRSLTAIRKEANVSAAELGLRMDRSATEIWRIENAGRPGSNRADWTVGTLRHYLDKLGMELVFFARHRGGVLSDGPPVRIEPPPERAPVVGTRQGEGINALSAPSRRRIA